MRDSLINQGAVILGEVDHSVISNEVLVEEKAYVSNSVLMNGAKIESGAKVINAIIGPDTLIEKDEIVEGKDDDIELVVNQKGARK